METDSISATALPLRRSCGGIGAVKTSGSGYLSCQPISAMAMLRTLIGT